MVARADDTVDRNKGRQDQISSTSHNIVAARKHHLRNLRTSRNVPFKIPFLTNPSGPSRPCKNPSNLSFFCAVSKSCFLPAKASPGCPSRICLSCSSPGEGREEMCASRLDVAEEGWEGFRSCDLSTDPEPRTFPLGAPAGITPGARL